MGEVVCAAVRTDVIVLNGGSSAGKSSIAGQLQAVLPETYLSFSVDTLVDALPRTGATEGAAIRFGSDGAVIIGPDFTRLENAWLQGLAAMARAGAGLIIDDAFLSGAVSQRRMSAAMSGLRVLWVGVRCDAAVAAAREAARADRVTGMAALQAETVHDGVRYDLQVDTSHVSAAEGARTIAAFMSG